MDFFYLCIVSNNLCNSVTHLEILTPASPQHLPIHPLTNMETKCQQMAGTQRNREPERRSGSSRGSSRILKNPFKNLKKQSHEDSERHAGVTITNVVRID